MSADDMPVTPPAEPTGARMARARVAAGFDLPALSAKTKIRVDHLQSLESGNLGALPGRTYVFGFARTYARAVGLDEAELIAALKADFDGAVAQPQPRPAEVFQPGDPARAPSARFALLAGGGALVLAGAGFALTHDWSGATAELPSLLPHEAPAPRPAPHPLASALAPVGGPVVFTAGIDGLWVKFYDADGKQLMQKQMAKGETYSLPGDAKGPMIWTAHPEALAITIGGRPVPPLSATQQTVHGAKVDAASLLARQAAPAGAGAPSAMATPTFATPAAATPPVATPTVARPATAPLPVSPPRVGIGALPAASHPPATSAPAHHHPHTPPATTASAPHAVEHATPSAPAAVSPPPAAPAPAPAAT